MIITKWNILLLCIETRHISIIIWMRRTNLCIGSPIPPPLTFCTHYISFWILTIWVYSGKLAITGSSQIYIEPFELVLQNYIYHYIRLSKILVTKFFEHLQYKSNNETKSVLIKDKRFIIIKDKRIECHQINSSIDI